jgi:hypothetical protein
MQWVVSGAAYEVRRCHNRCPPELRMMVHRRCCRCCKGGLPVLQRLVAGATKAGCRYYKGGLMLRRASSAAVAVAAPVTSGCGNCRWLGPSPESCRICVEQRGVIFVSRLYKMRKRARGGVTWGFDPTNRDARSNGWGGGGSLESIPQRMLSIVLSLFTLLQPDSLILGFFMRVFIFFAYKISLLC